MDEAHGVKAPLACLEDRIGARVLERFPLPVQQRGDDLQVILHPVV
jgi:hypothetical protein